MVSFETFSWIFWKQKTFLNLDLFQPSNPNIHFVRLTINEPSPTDGGNYIVRAVNAVGEGLNPHFPSLNLFFNLKKNHFHSSLPKFPPLFFWRKILNQLFEGEKDCTLALNFGGGAETEDNVPARFQLLCLMFCQVTFLSFFMFCHLTFPPTFLTLPCRVYEQPLLLQPDPNTLILEGHIHANPKPKVLHNAL